MRLVLFVVRCRAEPPLALPVGNLRINRHLHIMAIVQLRNDTEGLCLLSGKLAAGRTPMEALRTLKRRQFDIVYRQLVADQKRLQQNVNETDKGGRAGAATGCSAAEIGYRQMFPERMTQTRRRGGMRALGEVHGHHAQVCHSIGVAQRSLFCCSENSGT
jgi:hypothetical protein